MGRRAWRRRSILRPLVLRSRRLIRAASRARSASRSISAWRIFAIWKDSSRSTVCSSFRSSPRGGARRTMAQQAPGSTRRRWPSRTAECRQSRVVMCPCRGGWAPAVHAASVVAVQRRVDGRQPSGPAAVRAGRSCHPLTRRSYVHPARPSPTGAGGSGAPATLGHARSGAVEGPHGRSRELGEGRAPVW